jgi:hypothetical protein
MHGATPPSPIYVHNVVPKRPQGQCYLRSHISFPPPNKEVIAHAFVWQ